MKGSKLFLLKKAKLPLKTNRIPRAKASCRFNLLFLPKSGVLGGLGLHHCQTMEGLGGVRKEGKQSTTISKVHMI